ncbi:SflA family class IV lanthipeptide [Streptomyces subrutilus]|uniref:Uncharacterized protein n=1 Tax=Streptomyces subrutilus TaxID=36818 RepID=A0A918V549_9ACTN|nr:SflA family class IV lanthipeptide [Streptomyces subrutilus]WSJ28163.1 SflA family class IV lanthipeptide [Streptomyces subrutilus]GGZ70455.1 hypothetical protein GCM10010371_32960 [Streptomyces subrutilus]
MSSLELQIRDAGPLDLEDEPIAFEDDVDPGRRVEACLADPWVTATTRFACD